MRKKRTIPEPSRLDSFGTADLINLLEASMMRNAELFRGLSHSELSPVWVLDQMTIQTEQMRASIQALQRKVELQTF